MRWLARLDASVELEDVMLVECRVLVAVGFRKVFDRDPAATAAEQHGEVGIGKRPLTPQSRASESAMDEKPDRER